MQVRLQLPALHVAPLDPWAAEICDIRGSWGYSEAQRLLPRKFGFWLETRTPVFLWGTRVVCYTRHTGTRGWKCLVMKSTVHLVCGPWLYDLHNSWICKTFFSCWDFEKFWEKGFNNQNTVLCNHCSCVCFSFPRVFFFLKAYSWPRYIAIACYVRVIKPRECSCIIMLSSFALLCVPEHLTGSNRFCEDWMQAFVNGAEGGNPFLFRQILENFKLKVPVPIF